MTTTTAIDLRKTKQYKTMNLYDACETVEWSEDATEEDQLIAWQWLHDTGHAVCFLGLTTKGAITLFTSPFFT